MYLLYISIFSLWSFTFAVNINALISPALVANSAPKLPPSTHATLTTLLKTYSAPLRTKNDFYFRNLTTGSFLMDIRCHSYAFAPLRVDVWESKGMNTTERVEVWGTFRGNEWENKGESVIVHSEGDGDDKRFIFEVKMLAPINYITERPRFYLLNMLKNPMILMAGLTMIIVFGMPYLIDNLDPELKAEFEQRRKPAVIASAPNPIQNFDAVAWLTAKTKSESKN